MKHLKKLLCITIGMLTGIQQMFASDVNIPQLENIANIILGFFTSKPVQIFFAIAFAAMAVGFVTQRDNEQAKKKFFSWGLAIGLVLSASYITGLFFTEGAVIL